MGFAGTVSVSPKIFMALFREVAMALGSHGFRLIYVLNGHGANLEPLRDAAAGIGDVAIHTRSWWDFDAVNALRREYYGDWEGMHATPSEISITQATHRIIPPGDAIDPPEKLSPAFIAAHAGDRHGPPEEHRRQFPDGRVGSHSALARQEHGTCLLETAAKAVADEFSERLISIAGH